MNQSIVHLAKHQQATTTTPTITKIVAELAIMVTMVLYYNPQQLSY